MLRRLLALGALIMAQSSSMAATPVVHAFAIIDDQGHRSLLIPSLHVPALGIAQPSPLVLQNAAQLVVEHLGLGTPPVSDAASDDLAPWAAALTPVQRRTYEARARCAGKSPADADEALRLPAVQVANQYAYASCSVAGNPSRDAMLAVWAFQLRIPITPLEDDDWAAGQRAKVPLEVQAAGFRWILDRDVDAVLKPIVEAFNSGDFDAVARLSGESVGSAQGAQRVYEPMVLERNRRWMEVLPEILATGNAVIVVGAMHVAGPQGLVRLLRDQGYEVESVALPALPPASQ